MAVEVEKKSLRIERTNPRGVKAEYCNDVLVQHSQNEFLITFSVATLPPVADEEKFKSIDKIEAEAVARIIVTPDYMRRLIELMEENYQGYSTVNKLLKAAKAGGEDE